MLNIANKNDFQQIDYPQNISVTDKMIRWLQGKGAAMGFFGFLPAVGDIILVALGFMRANVPVVMLSMTVGKFLRYVLIGFGVDKILGIF